MDWDYSTSNTNNYLHMTLLTYHDLNKPSKHLCLTLASASWFMHQLRICFHTKKKLPALQCRIKGLPLTLFTGYYWLLPCIMHQNLTKHRNYTSHKPMQGLALSQIIVLLNADVCAIIVQTSAFPEKKNPVVVHCMGLTRSLTGIRGLCYCM